MTCAQIADFLMDYLSGGLPRPAAEAFESHLRVCEDCRNYIDSYRKTVAMGRNALDAADEVKKMPDSLIRSILHASGKV
jgi:anti-sigma factor RsiW